MPSVVGAGGIGCKNEGGRSGVLRARSPRRARAHEHPRCALAALYRRTELTPIMAVW
jgi:hypothetical protein